MESTYPYLKGGVSAVIHDIVTQNADLTFGIIHITWDSASPMDDLYGVPANVAWIHPVFLSMREHRAGFMSLVPASLNVKSDQRAALARRLFDAIAAIPTGNMAPMWELFDEGMNPLTRRYPIWALLSSREFMTALCDRLPGIGLPLTDVFWLMRDFFSLSYALLSDVVPEARVYHAHTTGYASLLAAAAARQHQAAFLLTEHNLYARDTVNLMLGRNMALPVRVNDWREFDVTPIDRAWMAWWIEMGRFCYPSADHVTYLSPSAIAEARYLGAPADDHRVSVVPNGMVIKHLDDAYDQRLQAIPEILAGRERNWRLAYIGRVVPIKGLLEFVTTAKILVDRGVTNWTLDILGPTDHGPADYLESCLAKIEELGVGDYFNFRGTVKVPAVLGTYDLLILPSFNEGQPMVVLEAMTAAIPTVGTSVGGMQQLVLDRLIHGSGRVWDACGVLADPADITHGMADAIQSVLGDPEGYERMARNARGRVEDFFQLHQAMALYNNLYRMLGKLGSSRAKVPAVRDARRGPVLARGPFRGTAHVPADVRRSPDAARGATGVGHVAGQAGPHTGARSSHPPHRHEDASA